MIERIRQVLDGVSFHRGLALGALVGAAIAGSTLWTKVREARDHEAGSGTASSAPERASSGDRSHAAN